MTHAGVAVADFDTNVLVSALNGQVQVAFDARILTEYREVLLRPKFGSPRSQVHALLQAIEAQGIAAVGPFTA